MGVNKPYKRNARIFVDGHFSDRYITHPKYADSPEHYIRAFLLIQKDLQELFDYIEPADTNLITYSYRIHALLLRTCVEVEANLVAILKENGYKKNSDFNMEDYKKINNTHRLSSYKVKVPIWNGIQAIREPFKPWQNNGSLAWYRAYNETKHDRHSKFVNATFGNLIDAVCGLVAVLASQFLGNDFSPGNTLLALEDQHKDSMEVAIGNFFRVMYPADWKNSERYDFNWQELKEVPNPFMQFDYNSANQRKT